MAGAGTGEAACATSVARSEGRAQARACKHEGIRHEPSRTPHPPERRDAFQRAHTLRCSFAPRHGSARRGQRLGQRVVDEAVGGEARAHVA